MSKARDRKYKEYREKQQFHREAIAAREIEDFYAREIHECPQCVVDTITRKDSKGRDIGYMYTQHNHIGGGLFLQNSAPEFRTWQASLEDQQGKRLHQKYYH